MKRVLIVFLVALIQIVSPAVGQGPDAEWKTLETEHFRVHYTAPAEGWVRRAVARLESIRQRVSEEVGYSLETKVDVLVTDPIARANGIAWPLLGSPRMVLYTTPPGPASAIGFYRDWGETLLVHEDTHLVHLLRPSRNAKSRFLSNFVPLGPIAQRAPRWVSEGYATLVEGRLTGYGRPNGDLRATILRRWAQQGTLPSYSRMAADGQSWLGMSMAYLVGSAYLEWLVERAGPQSLQHLWARLTARQERSFEEAFVGVFGDAPHKLYNRFRAELTYRAMRVEEEREAGIQRGALWQDLSWSSGSPTLSSDGKHLALVLRSRDAPSRMVVWATAENQEVEEEWQERLQELTLRDPEDIPPVRTKPLPRKALFELPTRNGAEPYTPRFTADGQSLLFLRFEPNQKGILAPDLFRWTLRTGAVQRLTRGAAVRDPDPSPDGTWAVAVRHRHGRSQLVRIDLTKGSVEPLTAPSLDTTWDHPRLSPDGEQLAVVRHRDGAWRLVIYALKGRELSEEGVELPAPPRTTVAYPEWSKSGETLYATLGEGGFLEIHAWDLKSGHRRPITRSHGAAFAPAPTPGGDLFYLGLDVGGLDLRFLQLESSQELPPWDLAGREHELAPAVRPPEPPQPSPFREVVLPASRPYGWGRLELLPLLGGTWGPGQETWEAGVRAGDLLGRFNALAFAATSDGGAEGGALRFAWRGWPVELGLHLVAADEQPSKRSLSLALRYQGIEATARFNRHLHNALFTMDGGAYFGELEALGEGRKFSQESLFLNLRYQTQQALGSWRFDQDVALRGRFGQTESQGWQHTVESLRLGVGRKNGTRLGLAWQWRQAKGGQFPFDRLQLGGLKGSLLPASAISGRIQTPAFETASLLGDDYEGQRVELRLGEWPVTAFYERHRLRATEDPAADWLSLRGLEVRFARAPWPLLRLPALQMRFGVAEILDGPLADRVEWWFGLKWDP